MILRLLRNKPIWLGLFLLKILASTAPAYAITFDEFQFRLDEAVRRQSEAAADIKELKSKLADMIKLGTPLEERKVYSEELIAAVAEMEKVKEEIEELKKLLPKLKVTPLLKLTKILPEGAPGRASTKSRAGSDSPKSVLSIRAKQVPLEIVPDRVFTVAGDIIWREHFAKGGCKDESLPNDVKGYPSFRMTAGPRSAAAGEEAPLAVGIHGKGFLDRFCEKAPTARDPDTDRLVMAEHEQEIRLKYNVRFVPQGQDKREDGTTVYRYKLETSGTGVRESITSPGALLTSSRHTSGQGYCVTQDRSRCARVYIELFGLKGSDSITLVYEQIAPGDQFIRSIPRYSHPSSLNSPPFVGSVSFATTVPNLVGLTKEEAEETLRRARLKWNLDQFVSAPSRDLVGKVKASRPKAGKEIQIGATVSLTLYSDKLKVPNVVGKSSKDAKRVLRDTGFDHAISLGEPAASREWAGKVISQSPKEGKLAPFGSKVAIEIWGPVPELTPEESCKRSFPGSVPSGERNAQGGNTCVCPTGKKWNNDMTKCIKALSPNQSCAQNYPGSVASGERNAAGGNVCVCPSGKKWNKDKTECITFNESCKRSYPGSVYSGRRDENGIDICECPRGKEWNRGKTRCVQERSGNQKCADDYPGSVSSGRRNEQGGWTCVCPTGRVWNNAKTKCIRGLAPNESCARSFPGSVFSGQRGADGGNICSCPRGLEWNRGKTECIPERTPNQKCARDYPGSISSGQRNAQGGWTCICPRGMMWNNRKTHCIPAPRLSDAQICARDFHGSVPSGRHGPNGGPECVCRRGQRWNNNRTACIDATIGGQNPLCTVVMNNIQYARRNNDQTALRSQTQLAQSMGCLPPGGGGGGTGGGGGGGGAQPGCTYTEGLLGQDDPGMANCRCNGRPAPLWRCGR